MRLKNILKNMWYVWPYYEHKKQLLFFTEVVIKLISFFDIIYVSNIGIIYIK